MIVTAVPIASPWRRRRPAALAAAAAITAGGLLGACGVSAGSDPAEVATGPAAPSTSAPADTGTDQGGPTPSTTGSAGADGSAMGDALFLRDAAQATAEVTSLKMAMSVALTGTPDGDVTVLSYEGAFDSAAQRAHITMDMGDLLGMAGAESGAMEMIVDGTTAYIRSELFASFGDGKPWLSVSADELAGGDGLGAGGVVAGVEGPESFLQFLEGAGDEVETVGREQVRGVDTTHVHTHVDLAGLLAEAAPEEAAELEDSLAELGAADVVGVLPVDAWVDDDGFVRRLRIGFDLGGLAGLAGDAGAEVPEGMAGATMVLDLELYDLGEPVEIVLPDPAEVGSIDGSLFGG